MHDSTNLPRDRQKPTVDFTVRTKPTVRLFACPLWQCTVRRKRGRALLAAPPTHATAVRWSRLRRSMRAALRRAACAAAAARIPPSSPSLHRTAPHCGHRAQWGGCACIGLCACGIECLCATGSENHPQRVQVRRLWPGSIASVSQLAKGQPVTHRGCGALAAAARARRSKAWSRLAAARTCSTLVRANLCVLHRCVVLCCVVVCCTQQRLGQTRLRRKQTDSDCAPFVRD